MNKRRKAEKAFEIGNYHYEKANYNRALESYLRSWKYNAWFHINDIPLYKIAYSYKCLWDYKKALKIIEYIKTCSTDSYEVLELKIELLKCTWNKQKAQICQKEIDKIDKIISDDTLLDEYLKLTA